MGTLPLASDVQRLAKFVKAAASAVGIDPDCVAAGPGAVGLIGTGVEVRWVPARGAVPGGWVVNETCSFRDPVSNRYSDRLDVVARTGERDFFAAAQVSVMRVMQRRIENALDGMAGSSRG